MVLLSESIEGLAGPGELKLEKPELITLDLQMSGDTGTRFYRNLSKSKEFKDLPVIVVSGIPGRHLAVSKPVAVFDKPIDRGALREAVKKIRGKDEDLIRNRSGLQRDRLGSSGRRKPTLGCGRNQMPTAQSGAPSFT
ncbi:MAG: hypothetical protein P8182_17255 [Deltaproteobacteria bacterium]